MSVSHPDAKRKRGAARGTLKKLGTSIKLLQDFDPIRLQMKELDQKLEELRKVNETFETYQQAVLSDLTEQTPDYQTEVDIVIEFEKIHRVLLNNVFELQRLHLAYIGVHHFEIKLREAEEMSNSGDESVTSVMTELVETYQKLRVTLSSTAAFLCKTLTTRAKIYVSACSL